MQIHIKQLNSPFIWETDRSDIWGKELSFCSEKSYLITAPSGAGKSTLFNLLCGLKISYTGVISWDGRPIESFSQREVLEYRTNRMSFVFQELELFENLTVQENVQILENSSKNEEIYQDWADRVGIGFHWRTTCSSLSKGQKQRVAILRALAKPYSFLLMDEPFSHLDYETIEPVKSLILEVTHQKNAGMMLFSLEEDYGMNYDAKFKL